jgi:hypothetical protein
MSKSRKFLMEMQATKMTGASKMKNNPCGVNNHLLSSLLLPKSNLIIASSGAATRVIEQKELKDHLPKSAV